MERSGRKNLPSKRVACPECRDEWLAAVYSDDTLITQLDGEDQAWKTALAKGNVTGIPTSSSSQPALMATMLEALDVEDGQRVLEIGTGTGHNAALMCEALGSGHVASIDIDAALVESARERLASCGYTPALAVADGADRFADGAPYDRIMATCSLPAVPPRVDRSYASWRPDPGEPAHAPRRKASSSFSRPQTRRTRPADSCRTTAASCRRAATRHLPP